jgi:hypothetical protein
MRVLNDDVWSMVLDGTFNGFSVEGMFGQDKDFELPETVINKIKEVIKKYKANKGE